MAKQTSNHIKPFNISSSDAHNKRTHFTMSLTRLNVSKRKESVGSVFQLICPEWVEGKHVLLIDDIITTGATLMSSALEIAKASDVSISIMSIYKVKKDAGATGEPSPYLTLRLYRLYQKRTKLNSLKRNSPDNIYRIINL